VSERGRGTLQEAHAATAAREASKGGGRTMKASERVNKMVEEVGDALGLLARAQAMGLHEDFDEQARQELHDITFEARSAVWDAMVALQRIAAVVDEEVQ